MSDDNSVIARAQIAGVRIDFKPFRGRFSHPEEAGASNSGFFAAFSAVIRSHSRLGAVTHFNGLIELGGSPSCSGILVCVDRFQFHAAPAADVGRATDIIVVV